MKPVLYPALILPLLAGCVSLSDKETARFDSMSCSQLAVALEYEQRGKRRAEEKGAFSSLTGLLGKGEARRNAELDAFGDDLDADGHRAARNYIRERQDLLGC